MTDKQKHGNIAIFIPHAGCMHRCSFCDQKTISGAQKSPSPDEVGRICREAISANDGKELELAFFGGSFTAIERGYMCSLLEAASEFVGQGISGIRLSTRPDAVGEDMLRLLRGYPVAAIELGAQSLDDNVLQKNNRGHTARDVIEASERIKGFGFELGLQMMIGLDGEDEQSCLASAMALISCRPDTVRLYPALALEGTELGERVKRGEYTPLTLDEGIKRTASVIELISLHLPDTKIIRVGLHPSRELEQKLLGGPYHPAFRELCEGELMFNRLTALLENKEPGRLTVRVHPRDVSRMAGQKRKNIERLAQMGFKPEITADEDCSPLWPETAG